MPFALFSEWFTCSPLLPPLLFWSFLPTLGIGLGAPPPPPVLLQPFPAGLIIGRGGRGPQIPAPPGRSAQPPLKPACGPGKGANWLGFGGNPPGKNGAC
uniref:Uncharacterized protein n=1 Tax=Arundo donax TaxID=35708 RepID=A0A0A9GCE4_ARUDO